MNFLIKVYTDGSCLGNPGVGGYGAYLQKFKDGELLIEAELKGSNKDTTNNRMEMMAIVKAMEFLNIKEIKDSQIEFFSDSGLIINTLNKNWKRKANTDIWVRMQDEINDLKAANNQLKFFWVKGHAGIKENEIVHNLAFSAATKLKEELS